MLEMIWNVLHVHDIKYSDEHDFVDCSEEHDFQVHTLQHILKHTLQHRNSYGIIDTTQWF
jgi:hypothetical protein